MTAIQAARDKAPSQAAERLPLPGQERWGYGVWLFTGAVIAVPELWAASGGTSWPTISATLGHLETLWSPVKILVVALIAAGAAQVLGDSVQAGARRTPTGRLIRGARPSDEIAWYFPGAVLVIVAATAGTAALTSATFTIGYVLYGLIALAFGIVPNVLAYWFGRDVPFPPLLRTLADLDRRWHPAAVVVVAGLSVLAVHLAAYPWP